MSPSNSVSSACFLRPRPISVPRLRLFCFPYAGGSAAIYHQWPTGLPTDIELVAVQYPGRATRLRESAHTKLDDLLDELQTALRPLQDRPFAFFGHSMGTSVAYELTRRLQAAQSTLPKHLFLSGRSAPHLPPKRAAIHALAHEDFVQALRTLNGTPAELLAHQEIMDMMLPTLRADFQVLETWQYQPSAPLDIPISVFGGLEDQGVPTQDLDAWAQCTTHKLKRHLFPGGHFFLNQQASGMLNIISRALSSY